MLYISFGAVATCQSQRSKSLKQILINGLFCYHVAIQTNKLTMFTDGHYKESK